MILLEREGEKINKIVLGKDFEVETLERINADYFDNNSLLKSKFQYNMQDRPEVFVNPIQGESSIPIVETITFNTSKYATGSTRQITEQELSNSINQLNPANPSTYRLSNPNPAFETKKIEDSGLYIDEGEENLGYFFVTLASTFEAKKAIYLIKNNFDIMTEWHHSDLKVELKNNTSHMDWDIEHVKRIRKALFIRDLMKEEAYQSALKEASAEEEVWKRKRKIRERISQDFYSAVDGIYKQRDEFDFNESSDPKVKAQELYKDKIDRRMALRAKLRKIYKTEAKNKYISQSNIFEKNFEENNQFEKYSVGRNYGRNPSQEYSTDFLRRIARSGQVRSTDPHQLRVDPELIGLIESLKEYSNIEIDRELQELIADYSEDASKHNMIEQLANFTEKARQRISLTGKSLTNGDIFVEDAIKSNKVATFNTEKATRELNKARKRLFSSVSAKADSYEMKKIRFMSRIGSELEGDIENLGKAQSIRDHIKSHLDKNYEMKDYALIRDINGDQFISQDDLDKIRTDISFSLNREQRELFRNFVTLREDREKLLARDQGKSDIDKRNRPTCHRLIEAEAGVVSEIYQPSKEEGTDLEAIVAALNKDLTYERYQIYSEESGKKRIVKIILPERISNIERLLSFIKTTVVPLYEKLLRTQGKSISEIQKIKGSLSIREGLRVTRELLACEATAEELFDAMQNQISTSEAELLISLQGLDEAKILKDVAYWMEVERAKEVVKPITNEDLLRYHRKALRRLSNEGKITKEELFSVF